MTPYDPKPNAHPILLLALSLPLALVLGLSSSKASAAPSGEVIIILDSSSSTQGAVWSQITTFASETVDTHGGSNISGGLLKIGIIRFGTTVELIHGFSDLQDPTSLASTLDSLAHTGGFTDTAAALLTAIGHFDAVGDPNAVRSIVLVTDGNPCTTTTCPQDICHLAEELFSRGIQAKIITVGGAVETALIDCIVEDPERDVVDIEDVAGNPLPSSILVLLDEVAACLVGSVNSGNGACASVLKINGFAGFAGTREVPIPTNSAFTLSMDSSPSGPANGRYFLLVWLGPPQSPSPLTVSGEFIGCFANPTPFHASAPQAFRCLRSNGMPAGVCNGIPERPAPSSTPWSATRPTGISSPVTFTLQGIVEDLGASNNLGFSTTNGVVLVVQ